MVFPCKKVLFQGVALFLALLAMPLSAVNVRDYGAKGDGVADDTAAIQKALNEANRQMTFVLAGSSKMPKWGGHGGMGGSGEVFFPVGTYRVSKPLFYKGHRIEFRAEPGTVLQAAGDHDIIYVAGVVHTTIENIDFRGGRIQFNAFTNNHDMCMIRVENCSFSGASLECIRSFNKGKGTSGNNNGQPPYNISKDANGEFTCEVNPDYEATTRRMPNSTLWTVLNCSFDTSATIFNGGSDTLIIDNCRVIRHASVNPIFLTQTKFHLRRSKFTYVNDGKDLPGCWLDSSSSFLDVMECGFDNGGVKFPLVISRSKPGYVINMLQVNGNKLNLAGAPIVKFAAGTLCGILEIMDNQSLSAGSVPAVVFERVPSLGEIQDVIRYKHHKGRAMNTQFKFILSGNQGFEPTLPEHLRQLVVKPLPADEMKAAYVKARFEEFWPQEKEFAGKEIRVQLDNGKSFAANLREAARNAKAGDRIIIPAVRLELDSTVRIPAGVMVLSEGLATIVAGSNVKSMLVIEGKGNSIIRNLVLMGGTRGVEVKAKGGKYVFLNCHFFDQTDTGVHAMEKPEGLQIRDSIYYSGGGCNTNAAHSEIIRNWGCNTPLMNEKGFFINNGGDMLGEYNLFVPILPRMNLENGKVTPGCENLDCGNNIRWFDCVDGRTALLGNRFGGEFLGMTPAYTFGNKASLQIRGGYAWYGNVFIRRCYVYCHDVPARVLLQGIVGSVEGLPPNALSLPYNVTLRDAKNGKDIIGAVLPQVKASALTQSTK